MKKVRYVLGAAAFAAPVFGVMAPPAANAATTAPDTGCTGVTGKKVTGSSDYIKFWHTGYSQSQCIGTVVGHFSYTDSTGMDPAPTSFRVTIRHNGTVVSPPKVVGFGADPPSWSTVSVGLHRRYADPVEVCGAFLSSGHYAADFPPVCTTVG